MTKDQYKTIANAISPALPGGWALWCEEDLGGDGCSCLTLRDHGRFAVDMRDGRPHDLTLAAIGFLSGLLAEQGIDLHVHRAVYDYPYEEHTAWAAYYANKNSMDRCYGSTPLEALYHLAKECGPFDGGLSA